MKFRKDIVLIIVGLFALIVIVPIVFVLGGIFAVINYCSELDIDFQKGKINKKQDEKSND